MNKKKIITTIQTSTREKEDIEQFAKANKINEKMGKE